MTDDSYKKKRQRVIIIYIYNNKIDEKFHKLSSVINTKQVLYVTMLQKQSLKGK